MNFSEKVLGGPDPHHHHGRDCRPPEVLSQVSSVFFDIVIFAKIVKSSWHLLSLSCKKGYNSLSLFFRKSDPASIDNFAFKLHYRATFVVLLICMALVSARQYIGDPIQVSNKILIIVIIIIIIISTVYCRWSPRRSNGPLLLDPLHILSARVRSDQMDWDGLQSVL